MKTTEGTLMKDFNGFLKKALLSSILVLGFSALCLGYYSKEAQATSDSRAGASTDSASSVSKDITNESTQLLEKETGKALGGDSAAKAGPLSQSVISLGFPDVPSPASTGAATSTGNTDESEDVLPDAEDPSGNVSGRNTGNDLASTNSNDDTSPAALADNGIDGSLYFAPRDNPLQDFLICLSQGNVGIGIGAAVDSTAPGNSVQPLTFVAPLLATQAGSTNVNFGGPAFTVPSGASQTIPVHADVGLPSSGDPSVNPYLHGGDPIVINQNGASYLLQEGRYTLSNGEVVDLRSGRVYVLRDDAIYPLSLDISTAIRAEFEEFVNSGSSASPWDDERSPLPGGSYALVTNGDAVVMYRPIAISAEYLQGIAEAVSQDSSVSNGTGGTAVLSPKTFADFLRVQHFLSLLTWLWLTRA
jgi:hypothetical protein